jgi:hypothetical protein
MASTNGALATEIGAVPIPWTSWTLHEFFSSSSLKRIYGIYEGLEGIVLYQKTDIEKYFSIFDEFFDFFLRIFHFLKNIPLTLFH